MTSKKKGKVAYSHMIMSFWMNMSFFRRHLSPFLLCMFLFGIFGALTVSSPSKADAPKTYTVKFYLNDGTGLYKKAKKTENVGLKLPEVENKYDGFFFFGWSYNKNAINPDLSLENSYEENKSATLYAIWRRAGEIYPTYTKEKRPIVAKKLSVKKGKSAKIKFTSKGFGKTKLSFKSSNKKVAKVSSSGKVTGLKKGKVKITISSKQDGLYAKTKKTITVKVK